MPSDLVFPHRAPYTWTVSSIGAIIQDAREARGLSRSELARLADITQVYVGKIETGHRRPAAGTLAKIASALQLEASDLLARAAVLDATTETSGDELKRRLVRAAAISANIVPLIAVSHPGVLGAAAGAVAEGLRRRRQARSSHFDDDSSELVDVDARAELLEIISELDDDGCRELLEQIRVGTRSATTTSEA